MRPIDRPTGRQEHRDGFPRPGSTEPRVGKPYDAAPRTSLPDLADLYDRRRPELDWRDPGTPSTRDRIELSARPPDEDLRSLRPDPNRPARKGSPIGEPTMLDRGQRALQDRLAQPGQTLGLALLIASPFLLSALVAFILSVASPLRGTDRIPLATVLVLLFQAAMMIGSYALQVTALGRIWLVNLLTLATLMPLLALQSTFSGIPYVSASRSSAEPVVMTGIVTIVVLVAIALVSATLSYESPGDAVVLFLPAALIVPVVLGGPASDIPDRGLISIITVSVAAAIAAAGAQVLPDGIRPVIGPIAALVVAGALYAAGRGPAVPDTSGRIVSILLWSIIGLSVLLTVIVPLVARWLRHVDGAVRLAATERPA